MRSTLCRHATAPRLRRADACPGPCRARWPGQTTSAYNLPSRYILHTVGPLITAPLTKRDRQLLAACYRSCFRLAQEHQLKSIAFCCISTSEFHFPNDVAAQIAVTTIQACRAQTNSEMKVIFNVFKEKDRQLYEQLL
ncbi:MAG: macro domain-containing protein [Merdibacter sp.]